MQNLTNKANILLLLISSSFKIAFLDFHFKNRFSLAPFILKHTWVWTCCGKMKSTEMCYFIIITTPQLSVSPMGLNVDIWSIAITLLPKEKSFGRRKTTLCPSYHLLCRNLIICVYFSLRIKLRTCVIWKTLTQQIVYSPRGRKEWPNLLGMLLLQLLTSDQTLAVRVEIYPFFLR